MKRRDLASMLILPLLVGDCVIGTIGVASAAPREYRTTEIALALKAATFAAWAATHL
jgi:GAF domain-containing protein